jgi:hypothetical protein
MPNRFFTHPCVTPSASLSCIERERLLKLELERCGLEAQMLADETETDEGVAAAAARERDQVIGPAAMGEVGRRRGDCSLDV